MTADPEAVRTYPSPTSLAPLLSGSYGMHSKAGNDGTQTQPGAMTDTMQYATIL